MAENFKFVSPGVTLKETDIDVWRYPRFATHMVLFGQDKWILRNLENAFPHVETIYIAVSDKPWTYNPNARNLYSNNVDYKLILDSPFGSKVKFIRGEWNTEEEQRNACVDAAKRDGIDYLIIHDADEFYFHTDFQKLIYYICDNPNHDYYKVAWYCFWKSFKHILLDEHKNLITGYPEFCINLKNNIRFLSKRRPTSSEFKVIPSDNGICYHGSYVLTNEELLQKINTWGHTNDFDKNYWYNEKWLKWNEDSMDLHLVYPPAWSKAVRFEGKLPEVIEDMI